MHSIPIIRKQQTTDQTSPWDGINFTHEVGSDELAETLKDALPRYRTLRERKHAAAIKFLVYELCEMQSTSTTPASTRTLLMHDLLYMRPLASEADEGTKCTVHSQDLISASHPPATSVNSAAHGNLRQPFEAIPLTLSQPLFINPTTAASSSQFVFNAIDGRVVQQKYKRKMTAEERLGYRETRRRGACLNCKRQKGKVRMLRYRNYSPLLTAHSALI